VIEVGGPGRGRVDSGTRRRRREAVLLRWQGRLEGPLGDWLIPSVVGGVLFVGLMSAGLAWVGGPRAGGELAPMLQTVWLLPEGPNPVITVSTGVGALAADLELLVVPLGWLARLGPRVPTLVVLQAAALALGVLPLWRIARVDASLRVGAATTLVVAYALYPVVHITNLDGVSTSSVALPALLWAAHGCLSGRRIGLWVSVVVVLACRADLGLAVAGLGMAMWLVGRRVDGRMLAGVGTAWWVVAVVVVQPWLAGGRRLAAPPFARYGDTPLGVAWGIVSKPLEVVGNVAAESTLTLLVVTLGPVLFLPLLAPRLLVGVLPVQALHLLADVPDASLRGGLAVPLAAFVFLASAFALARLGRPGVVRVAVDPRLLAALLAASLAFFVTDSPTSPYRQPWSWGTTSEVTARQQFAEGLDPDVAVRASAALANDLASRVVLQRFEPGAEPDAAAAAAGVDVVALTATDWSRWDPLAQRVFTDRLVSLGFTPLTVPEGAGVVAWRLPASTSLTD